jgi:hypothetical protein
MRAGVRAIGLGLVSAMFLAAAATHWLWSVAGPDARIVGHSLRENQNYPTDLPLSFLLVALTLVLLGRWSAYIIEVQQLEFAAILPLVLAGLLLRRRLRQNCLQHPSPGQALIPWACSRPSPASSSA